MAKYSGLAERARHLREQLGECDVLPVVFTRADVVPSDRQQAYEHGIAIVGHGELRELLTMVESGSVAKESLAYLQGLLSDLTIELGRSLNSRWAPRW